MRNITHLYFSIIVLMLGCTALKSGGPQITNSISGAWQLANRNEEQVLLFIDGYFSHTTYDKESKRFIQTRGGTYSLKNGKLNVIYEFDTNNKDQVGQSETFTAEIKNTSLTTNINGANGTWSQIDNGMGNLSGLWKITKRREEGNIVPIHQGVTRKTVKILTATRFQWAAIDPGKKEFLGTGGGTYTFSNGKYTENIEFFSRDSTRVGNSLTFDGKIENGDWHHSGLSSRGDPIYEVWSRAKQ